jgi:hypothetical protein
MKQVNKLGHLLSEQLDENLTEGLGLEIAQKIEYDNPKFELEWQLVMIEEV